MLVVQFRHEVVQRGHGGLGIGFCESHDPRLPRQSFLNIEELIANYWIHVHLCQNVCLRLGGRVEAEDCDVVPFYHGDFPADALTEAEAVNDRRRTGELLVEPPPARTPAEMNHFAHMILRGVFCMFAGGSCSRRNFP